MLSETQTRLVTVASEKATETARLHEEREAGLQRIAALSAEVTALSQHLQQTSQQSEQRGMTVSQLETELRQLQQEHTKVTSEVR